MAQKPYQYGGAPPAAPPRPAGAPIAAPGRVDLAALARSLPLQGRGLPMMQGSLGPDRNMLLRQALLAQIRGGQ